MAAICLIQFIFKCTNLTELSTESTVNIDAFLFLQQIEVLTLCSTGTDSKDLIV